MKKLKFLFAALLCTGVVVAQESTDTEKPAKENKPVKEAFESNWIMNNQTMIVPFAHTLEFDICHRFGVVENGFDDLIGMYAPSNIRLGLSFTPIKNLQVGAGITKELMMNDLNIKYNILQQTQSNSIPVFVTYYGNMVIEGGDNNGDQVDSVIYRRYPKEADRFSYFNQLIIGRKFSKKITIQLSGSYAHFNLIDTTGNPDLKHDNMSVGLAGRFKCTPQMSVLFAYDYQLNPAKDVKPNAALGVEWSTGSHAFQIFLSPYRSIMWQRDMVYNRNDFTDKGFALSFNITRLWGF